MPTFMETAACEGRRPRHLASLRCFPRSDLVARLLHDRQVARFVVAPDGFGKSSLAFGYAETVFSFQHVLWINAKSPCFLRDLDLGVIASGVRRVDEEASLVVMDDVPALSPERAGALSGEIDVLLSGGCEVLVCCTPSSDAYGLLQRDRLKLDSSDLLLSCEGDAHLGGACNDGSRVAGLRQGSSLSAREFLDGIAREDLPADLVLPMLVMLALGEGSLEELEAFGIDGADAISLLAESYPFLGIDHRSGMFSAPWFEPADIMAAFSRKLEAAAARSHFSSASALACAVSDALLARGLAKRACETVGAACSNRDIAAWLALRRFPLAQQGCILPAYDISFKKGKGTRSVDASLEADDAWRAAMLGDAVQACRHARRAAGQNDELAQVMGLLVLARYGTAKESSSAAALLAGWCAAPLSGEGDGDVQAARWTRPLAVMHDLAEMPPCEALAIWRHWAARGAHRDALSIAAMWLFEDVCVQQAEPGALGDDAAQDARAFALEDGLSELLLEAATHVAAQLRASGDSAPDAFTAFACAAWGRLLGTGALPEGDDPLDSADAARAAREAEDRLFSQRREFESQRRASERKRREYALTHPDSFLDGRYRLDAVRAAPREPLLTVKLFGGVEVCLGDQPVDPEKLRRQKVKTLLALLVMNRGRELSRDRLLAMMWPDSDPESARKNFYTIWSLLRAALTLPDGSCPYLIRQQNVCRLNATLFRSDVAEFDEVCRALMFADLGTDGWARLAAQVDERFSDDLMPGEQGTAAIERMRAECRMRLVDSLVTAAKRLGEAGHVQESLWFARAALRRDESREDAYTVLMRAQVAAGQRAAALDTYFTCRRYLADGLGIDPSLETMAVYRGIIETEEGLI